MAKETQKAKIERLESELTQAHKRIQEQNDYINKMQVLADNSFSNSPFRKQLEDKIQMLEMKLKSSERAKEHAEKIAKARDEQLQEIEEQYKDNAYHNYMESNLYQLDVIKYEKLEAKAKKQKEQIQQLINENEKLQEQTKQLKAESKIIEDLNKQIEDLKAERNVHKIKNERKAGRKQKFTNAEIQAIKMYRLQGKSYRAIAEIFDCSVGLVHKIINEQKD